MRERAIRCDCIGGEHYIMFHYSEGGEEPPLLFVDLCATIKCSFWIRAKEAWNILTGKPACYDGIILSKDKCNEVISFVKDSIKWMNKWEKERESKKEANNS